MKKIFSYFSALILLTLFLNSETSSKATGLVVDIEKGTMPEESEVHKQTQFRCKDC
jgi:hypothetical protein